MWEKRWLFLIAFLFSLWWLRILTLTGFNEDTAEWEEALIFVLSSLKFGCESGTKNSRLAYCYSESMALSECYSLASVFLYSTDFHQVNMPHLDNCECICLFHKRYYFLFITLEGNFFLRRLITRWPLLSTACPFSPVWKFNCLSDQNEFYPMPAPAYTPAAQSIDLDRQTDRWVYAWEGKCPWPVSGEEISIFSPSIFSLPLLI